MGSPWFKFYGQDFLGDPKIRLLTDADRGVFVDCLAIQATLGGIPMDPVALGKLFRRRADHAVKAFSRVACFFVEDPSNPGFMVSMKLAQELATYEAKVQANQSNGRRGGRPRKNPLGLGDAIPPENPAGLEPEPEPEPRGAKAPVAAPRASSYNRKPAAKGPNTHLVEELQVDFWRASKLVPPEKFINPSAAAKAWSDIVGSGVATGPELSGCLRRYVTTFTPDRRCYIVQFHAWLEGAGFMAFLDAERRGEPDPLPTRGPSRGPFHKRPLTPEEQVHLEEMP